jgi:hypothetical protein
VNERGGGEGGDQHGVRCSARIRTTRPTRAQREAACR